MKLHSVQWSESFAGYVQTALGSDLGFIRQEVEAGFCQCWEFGFEDEIFGYVVTRLEGDTLVVVAYEGLHVKGCADLLVQICEIKGLPYIRFHTQRPGLIRLLKDFNPEPLEYVVRIKCNGR